MATEKEVCDALRVVNAELKELNRALMVQNLNMVAKIFILEDIVNRDKQEALGK